MRAVVVGQGYVGLPLAVAAARAGHHVTAIDRSPARVAQLASGRSPVGDVANAELRAQLDAGRYVATADFAACAEADVVVLCVPTPFQEDRPDLSHIEAAGRSVGANLKPGTVVILESTTYPGTTEEVLLPLLEQESGLQGGADFELVFSPERIDPGNPRFSLRNTPKVVGGLTPEGTRRAADFYRTFVDEVHEVSGPKTAEMAKLLENTFRHINIALANEMAIIAHDLDIDVWEVIEAAATKPFGFMPFYPGPGVGGHCIPVDPLYLSWRARQFGGAAKFIDLARDVNEAMPHYVVTRVQDLLNDDRKALKGSRVLVLGVTYKRNVADLRETSATAMIERLAARGADVRYHDAHAPTFDAGAAGTLHSHDLTDDLLAWADCVVVHTDHDTVDYRRVAELAQRVLDTRNAVPAGRGVRRL